MQPYFSLIVAIDGNVQGAAGCCECERAVQALGEPHAAGMNADQTGFRPDIGPHFLGERLQKLLGVG